jgi:hypothetical protein
MPPHSNLSGSESILTIVRRRLPEVKAKASHPPSLWILAVQIASNTRSIMYVRPAVIGRLTEFNIVRRHSTHQVSGNTTGECSFSSFSTLKADRISMRMKKVGNSWFCQSVLYPVEFRSHTLYRYEKRKRKDTPEVATYHFAGYTSLYSFYHYPEKIRLRLRCVLPTHPLHPCLQP